MQQDQDPETQRSKIKNQRPRSIRPRQ